MADPAKFRKVVSWLRRKFPSCYPVRYYLRSADHMRKLQPNAKGCCEIFGDGQPESFRVSVLDSLSEEEMIQTVIHEHAHVLRAHIFRFGDLNADDAIRDLIEGDIWRRWHEEE